MAQPNPTQSPSAKPPILYHLWPPIFTGAKTTVERTALNHSKNLKRKSLAYHLAVIDTSWPRRSRCVNAYRENELGSVTEVLCS